MKRSPIKRKATKRSKQGQQAITEFRRQWPYCWVCYEIADAPHHIAKRRGKRFDDVRNLFATCNLCHDRIEGNPIVLNGKRLLPISLETVLDIKRTIDPDNFDHAFLCELSGRRNFGEGM